MNHLYINAVEVTNHDGTSWGYTLVFDDTYAFCLNVSCKEEYEEQLASAHDLFREAWCYDEDKIVEFLCNNPGIGVTLNGEYINRTTINTWIYEEQQKTA